MCLHKIDYKTTDLGTKPALRRNWWDTRCAQHRVWIGGAVLLLCVYLW